MLWYSGIAPTNCKNSDKLLSVRAFSESIFDFTKSFKVSLVFFDTIIEPSSSKTISIKNSEENLSEIFDLILSIIFLIPSLLTFPNFEEEKLILLYTYESDLGDGWEDKNVHNVPDEKRLSALKMGTNIIIHALTR